MKQFFMVTKQTLRDLISRRAEVKRNGTKELADLRIKYIKEIEKINQQIDKKYELLDRNTCLYIECQKQIFGKKRYCNATCRYKDYTTTHIPLKTYASTRNRRRTTYKVRRPTPSDKKGDTYI